MKCDKCGIRSNLTFAAGRVLCRKCYKALPRQRCAAVATSSPVKHAKRCAKFAVGEGETLCAHHRKLDVEALAWVVCDKCGRENVAGEPCFCGLEKPLPVEVRIIGEGAAILRRLKREMPGKTFGEIVGQALQHHEEVSDD